MPSNGTLPILLRPRRVALTLLLLALAGCATTPAGTASAPYVGRFTGQFVDGLPLFRFPSIEVAGSRRSAD